MIIIDLIFNLALLVSVCVLSGFVDNRWRRSSTTGIIFQGILFGSVALLGMVNPYVLAPGIIFDGRSVVLSLCGLFFGPVAGFIAAGMALVYRVGLGGSGVYMGVSVIITATLIGSAFHGQLIKGKFKANTLNLYLIGIFVHLVMIVLIMAIPSPMRLITFKTLTLTVLGFYPIATAIIGKILKDQSDSIERIKAEKALHESEARFRSLFENSLMGISESDHKGKLIQANMQYARMYGYKSPEEIIGAVNSVEDFYAKPEERDEILQILDKTGILEPREIEVKHRDGSRLVFIVSIREVRDRLGVLSRYQVAQVDITERKRAEKELIQAKEKAEAGDRLKSSFINNISHEVRTPLNGILGFTDLLRQPNLTDEEREHYNAIIHTSSMRLLSTMTNYMDISMIASGTMEISESRFEPNNILYTLKEQFQPMCNYKKLKLFLEISAKPEKIWLHTDMDHLKKIMSLLLDNALKFTHFGEISFGYTIQGERIKFFVTDTGTGIILEAIDKVFEDFIQEDDSHTRGYEGSGLGLSIVRGLIRLLGSEIRVNSEKGVGSTFYFSLPFERNIIEISDTSLNIYPVQLDKDQLVLIAEDDDSNMRYLERILKKANIQFVKAVNGNEAVNQCRENPGITLVLMDIKMPELDGLEATKIIKSFRSKLPVIAITAYAMSCDEKRLLEAGCDSYLAKPFGSEALLSVIKKTCLI